MDEFGNSLNETLAFARSPKGHRAPAEKPTSPGKRISTIGALMSKGLATSMCFEGTLNGYVFLYFVEFFLLQNLDESKVVILDNASPHYNEEALDLIRSTGAKIIFLPPYRPELNPIEYCWAIIKNFIRKIKPRTVEDLYETISKGLNLIDSALAKSCFQHCFNLVFTQS